MPTILVVDDDPAINRLLAGALAGEGFAVETATDGSEALAVLDRSAPDAIVLDLRMPVMDGWTFYHHLRNASRHHLRDIPVLILSADRAERARRELGAEAALSKPFDVDHLLEIVSELVTRRSDLRAASEAAAS